MNKTTIKLYSDDLLVKHAKDMVSKLLRRLPLSKNDSGNYFYDKNSKFKLKIEDIPEYKLDLCIQEYRKSINNKLDITQTGDVITVSNFVTSVSYNVVDGTIFSDKVSIIKPINTTVTRSPLTDLHLSIGSEDESFSIFSLKGISKSTAPHNLPYKLIDIILSDELSFSHSRQINAIKPFIAESIELKSQFHANMVAINLYKLITKHANARTAELRKLCNRTKQFNNRLWNSVAMLSDYEFQFVTRYPNLLFNEQTFLYDLFSKFDPSDSDKNNIANMLSILNTDNRYELNITNKFIKFLRTNLYIYPDIVNISKYSKLTSEQLPVGYRQSIVSSLLVSSNNVEMPNNIAIATNTIIKFIEKKYGKLTLSRKFETAKSTIFTKFFMDSNDYFSYVNRLGTIDSKIPLETLIRNNEYYHGNIDDLTERYHQLLNEQYGIKNFNINKWIKSSEKWTAFHPGISNSEFEIVPLTSTSELTREGREMSHCVGMYSTRCLSSDSMIYSVIDKSTNKRIGTIEYQPRIMRLVDGVKTYSILDSYNTDIPPTAVVVLKSVQYRGYNNKDVSNKVANALVAKLDNILLNENIRDKIIEAKLEYSRISRTMSMSLNANNRQLLLNEFKPLVRGIRVNHAV